MILVYELVIILTKIAVGFPLFDNVGKFAAGKVMAVTGLSAPVGVIKVAGDTKAMKEGLDFAGNLTRYATHVVANASQRVSHVARVGLNETASLGRNTLEGGVKIAKQGLKFAKTVSKHVPGYGTVITMGAEVGERGLTMANALAQKGIGLAASGGDKALNVGNRAVQSGAETFNSVAQTGISLGKNVVNRVDKAKDKVTGALSRYTGGLLFRNSGKTPLRAEKLDHY